MRNSGIFAFIVAVTASLSIAAHGAEKPRTEITWFGHAAFRVLTPKGKVLWIDPWLKNPKNPAAAQDKDPLVGIKGDYIFVTHGHFDHVGDAVEIAKLTHARLISNFELGKVLSKKLGFPADQMGFDTQMNIGGAIRIADGEVTVHMTPAVHSSGVDTEGGDEISYGGNPAGFVLVIKDGPAIYHSGDTAYFSDMKLIGQELRPDVALINAGGHFGMEPDQAVRAARDSRAGVVIPHHYGTFPVLAQDITPFAKALKSKVRVLKPGETLTFEGKRLKK